MNELKLDSTKLGVTFDSRTLEPVLLENHLTGETLVLAPSTSFRIQLEDGVVEARDWRREITAARPDFLATRYSDDRFEAEVLHTLAETSHFLSKRVVLRPKFESAFLIRRIDLANFSFSAGAGLLLPFQHGQCRTYFLRSQKGGFMFGIQVPVLDEEQRDPANMTLGYPVNYRFSSAEMPYQAETLFWGAYRLAGKFSPPPPEVIKECIHSRMPLDIGESLAVLEMAQTFLTRPPRPPRFAINGCQNHTTVDPFDEAHQASVEADKTFWLRAKDMLGECVIQPYATWSGAHEAVNALTSLDTRIPDLPVRDAFFKWAADQGFKIGMYTPMKGVFPWKIAGPKYKNYCRDRPEWKGGCNDSRIAPFPYNCPVNRPFAKWLAQMLVDDLRRHPVIAQWMIDEAAPYPRHALPCDSTAHDHLPGDAAYGYFLARRKLFQTIAAELPQIELVGERPNSDAGLWDAVYLDALFTLSEVLDGADSDQIRTWSRIRYYYDFLPPRLNEVAVKRMDAENVDYLMLSILAVSSNYIFCELPRTWSRMALRRIRKWADWARNHADLMNDCIFLPDWPGQGVCDGYIRAREGRGFAFFFNANKQEAPALLPLDASSGLSSEQTHRISVEHATPTTDLFPPQNAQGAFQFTLPPQTAVLLKLG